MLKISSPRQAIVGLSVAAALCLAACGGSDASESDDASSTDDAIATTSDAEAQEQPQADDASLKVDDSMSTSPDGINLASFFDGAIVNDPATVNCTLASGVDTDCYEITIAGYPTDVEIGPFCPASTSDTAEQGGIWLDGESIYDLDGQFILDLPEIYEDENWHLHDDEGNVHVTDTQEAFEAAARPDVDPEFQNHCVEGRIEWLDGGEPISTTVEIPAVPVAAATPTQIRGNVGITLNGVIIAAQAPVDAILGAYTIAAFDDCGGHINPNDGYHLHGATGCSQASDPGDGDTPAFAYALDGYAIHSPLAADDAAVADLDECNGHLTEASGYHYHANQPELNGVLTCLMGETTSMPGRP